MRLLRSLSHAVLISLTVALASGAGAAHAAGEDLITKKSNHSVKVTLDRLSAALQSKGITVMARIDHAAGAKKAGMELKPTELLIFGNPKLGTPLMQGKRTMGLDLPMKVLAWEDDKGGVWLAYTRPDVLKARHAITGRDKVFATMTKALDNFTSGAAK